VARANLLAARLSGGGPAVVNVGSGTPLTVLGLAQNLSRLLPGLPPTFGPRRPGDLHASCSENRRAEQALGFRPAVDMDLGLRRTVEWMQGR
jgi:nucleoside-diphosphate-sugar epimerase